MINPDSLLVAYVDDELDRETALKVKVVLATDSHALQRVEMFRETAALLRDAFGDRFFARKCPVPGPPAGRAGFAQAPPWLDNRSLPRGSYCRARQWRHVGR
jgi:anti-sigma factor RsiW